LAQMELLPGNSSIDCKLIQPLTRVRL
jgi:hypothetical protein